MKKLHPLQEHQGLLDIWKEIKIDSNGERYWNKIIIASKYIKDYFINLPSSQIFNDTVVKKFDYCDMDNLPISENQNQTIDITKVIGHSGHAKILDSSHTWRDILLNKLKCQTICHLINISIKYNQLYCDLYIKNLRFIKFEDKYYFSDIDGLHRTILAKYILSNNKDKFLYGVKVIHYI